MKLWILVISMCCSFVRISSQDCSLPGDFVCSNNNVHICLNTNADGHALMITCGQDLTCNIQNPADGCQSASVATDALSKTARGTCADNRLKISKSNCQSYHKCINGKMNRYTCPEKTCYSPDKAACIPGTCQGGVCVRGPLF